MAKPCFCHRLLAHEVEDMIGSSGQKVAYCLDRFGLLGVNDVSRAESFGRLQPLRLDVDRDDPRRPGYARAAHRIESHASRAEDHDAVAGGNAGGIQDSTGARNDAAAEQRRLGEGHLPGYHGELVFMDKRSFSKATQPETLEQANSFVAHARGIRRPAERRLGTSALEGAAR
jgi:hypothetical protein